VDNIIGIKEASANFEQIARIIDGVRGEFLVYSGNDSDTMSMLALSGYGVISVVSHLVGLQIKQMIDYAVGGKTKEAAQIHHRLLPLVNALFVVANPMPVKYALNYLGFPVGIPRLPLTEPDEKSKALIQETLKHYTIDLPIGSRV
jgi:4-hydroxy-tetrahydrodipicolinate synthase